MERFDRITISSDDILDYPASKRILTNLKKYDLLPSDYSRPDVVNTKSESEKLMFKAASQKAPNNHPVALGKKVLHLTTQPGTSVKQCPGTNNMLCCHYHVINFVSNCPFDCSYCYLQSYLNQPMTTFYVNEDDILKQVRGICENYKNKPNVIKTNGLPLRIGTGELGDSLALDPITQFSEKIAEVIGEYENVRLELKTKSKEVEHLLQIPKKDHIVIGWSVNPPEIVEKEEHDTARFEERIRAAQLAVEHGFNVAFHFDPMIYTENWQELYERTAKTLLNAIPHEKILWISIGGLRYAPQMKPLSLKRRPDTTLFADETTLNTSDGKTRYLRSMRTQMFYFLNHTIKKFAPSVYTYLCMESQPVWEKALGRMPDRGF